MNSIRRIRLLFWAAVVFQFLMAATIPFMPAAVNAPKHSPVMTALVGAVFWISAIIGYLLTAIANTERRRFVRGKLKGNAKMNCHMGIISFFRNMPATIADVMMILSFISFIIISFTALRYEYISYIILFLFVISLHMHCMFNGRIYKTTKLKPIRRRINHE